MTLAFISHSDVGMHDNGWNHPEHVGRMRAITRAMRYHPELFMALEHVEGRHATEAELALAHAPANITRVREMSEAGGGRFDADTTASPGSWAAATAAAGCVLEAVERAIDGRNARSFVAVRPPGHHALRDQPMGFCLFGNVAIGALRAQQLGARRVLIVDWDVHHGNGTQAIVETNADIHFISMHQWPWYPGSGAAEDRGPHGTVWNVPMPAGLPAAAYREALLKAIDAATDRLDPGPRDDLGRLRLPRRRPARRLLPGAGRHPRPHADARRACPRVVRGRRVVSVLEGGYEPDRVAAAVVAHLEALR
jgi:acetoin utilization deacetylase AcuC-like enzyme